MSYLIHICAVYYDCKIKKVTSYWISSSLYYRERSSLLCNTGHHPVNSYYCDVDGCCYGYVCCPCGPTVVGVAVQALNNQHSHLLKLQQVRVTFYIHLKYTINIFAVICFSLCLVSCWHMVYLDYFQLYILLRTFVNMLQIWLFNGDVIAKGE